MERKDEINLHRFCIKCGSSKLKDWDELTSDEKFLVERISSGRFFAGESKDRRFCARCFGEVVSVEDKRA